MDSFTLMYSLIPLLIYKALKHREIFLGIDYGLIPLLIYKALKPISPEI